MGSTLWRQMHLSETTRGARKAAVGDGERLAVTTSAGVTDKYCLFPDAPKTPSTRKMKEPANTEKDGHWTL